MIRRTTTILPFATLVACGGAGHALPGDSKDDTSSTSASGSDLGSSATTDGAADETTETTDTGETGATQPDVVDPWQPVTGEAFDVALGDTVTVYEPPADFDFGSFPVALSVPRGDGTAGARVLVGFSENEDAADAEIVTRTLATVDLGQTFAPMEPIDLVNAALLVDRTLLSVAFVPSWSSGRTTATVPTWRSTNGGASWSSEPATFDAGGTIRGLRFHRGMQQIVRGPDAGTILVPFYALLGDDATRTIGLAASDDGGATWHRWGTIAAPNHPTLTYDETSFAFTPTGDVVAVTRTYIDGELGPLHVCRSEDDGRTFSEPVPIEIAFGDEDPAPRVGVDPGLALLPSGVLLLVGGRPDNFIAFSFDDGHTWTEGHVSYVNRSAQHPFHGSSGYQGIAPTSSHRALLVGDNCANSWGCPATDDGWTVDGEHRIWRRLVDAMPLDRGRIDMATALERGAATVTTDLVAEDRALQAAALFDGSLAPGSALLGAGTITIDLGEPTALTRLSIAGAIGPGAATVRLFDGDQWIDPVISTSPGGDLALRAFVPTTPQIVERIEVDVSAGGGVSELEIYTTTDSFEDEALGRPPRAATEASLATVERLPADADADSAQAVRLHDTSTTGLASIAFALPSDADAVSLRVKASALPGSMLLGIADPRGPRVHLSLDADGRVRQYDEATETWSEIAGAGTVDPFTWFRLGLGASEVRFDDEPVAVRWPAAWSPAEVYVTSTGTAPEGVDLWLDDLRVQ